MKAKKILSKEKMNSVSCPATVQPIMNDKAHFTATKFLSVPVQTATEKHLEETRNAIQREETSKAGMQFLSSYGMDKAEFSPVSVYEKHLADMAEFRIQKEKARRIALGLLECKVPTEWTELVASKDRFTASLFGWLCSLAREFKLDDAYQIDLEDCIDDLPAYDRHGHVAGMDDKAKHFHSVWSKARSAILPLVDRYTGEVKRPGCSECRIQIERIKKADAYLVSFL